MESTLLFLLAAGVGGSCLGTFGYFLCKPKLSKTLGELDDVLRNLEDLNGMFKKVSEEKVKIIERLNNITECNINKLSQPDNRYKLFSIRDEPFCEDKREEYERNTLFHLLHELLDTYPEYEIAHVKKLGYVSNLYRETEEHHAKVVSISEQYFKKIEDAICQKEHSVTISLT